MEQKVNDRLAFLMENGEYLSLQEQRIVQSLYTKVKARKMHDDEDFSAFKDMLLTVVQTVNELEDIEMLIALLGDYTNRTELGGAYEYYMGILAKMIERRNELRKEMVRIHDMLKESKELFIQQRKKEKAEDNKGADE